jgi:hypothetical protein
MQGDPVKPVNGARQSSVTRLRLMDLTLAPGRWGDFGGGLACAFVSGSDRTPMANAIANAVIGPRPPEVAGTIEIAGRYVDLQSLPAPLLRPSAAPLVDRPLLDDLWQEVCVQRRARIESAHASRRLLRHRVAASLERARTRAQELAASPTKAEPSIAVVPAPEPVEAVQTETGPTEIAMVPAPDEVTPALQAVLAAYCDLAEVPVPEALALADEFDELAARPEIEVDASIDLDVVSLESRVAAARREVAKTAGIVRPEARGRIDEYHRAVVEAESALFEARRKDKARALARYQSALAAEHAVLAEAGVDSYAQFLVATAQGVPAVDLEARLRAETELADAQSALHLARTTLAAMHDGRNEVALALRARAAHLLGHFPGDDAAGQLRALRVEHPDAEPMRNEVRTILASLDLAPDRDVIGQAERVVADRIANPPMVPAPEREPVIVAFDAPVIDRHALETDPDDAVPLRELDGEIAQERVALHAEIAELTRERDELDELLSAFERELAYLDDVSLCDSARIDVDARDILFDALFDCYRAGDLLAGRLPIVFDGALDGMDPAHVRQVAERLQVLDDIQVIVVTSDREVERALDRVGARPVELASGSSREPAPESTAEMAMCREHPAAHASAACSQCGRPNCLDCLAYVPGEPELWCVSCAEARSRQLRLLRRRGA